MRRSSLVFVALAAGVRLVLTIHQTTAGVSDWSHSGDLGYYHDLASLSDQGLYPFIHFWTEYPPLFPFLITGFYRMLTMFGLADPERFSHAVQGLLYLVEVANIALIYGLVRAAHGQRAARFAAAVYAGCPMLVVFSAGWFDPLAVLFCLAALYALTSKRATTAGVLIALGILTKIYPGVLLVVAPAALGWRGTWRLVIGMSAMLGAVLLPLLAVRADLVVASFASMMTRPAWETLPALLSGNYAWGIQPDLADRFTAATAFSTVASPLPLTLVPEMVLLLAIVAAWLALNTRRTAARDMYALGALGVAAFVLGNKGFSPQFVVWIVPGILLVWPNRIGLVYVAALSAHFMFYDQHVIPAMYDYFARGHGTFETVARLEWASVLVRTALIALLAAHLFIRIAGPMRWPRLASWPRRRLAVLPAN